MENGCGNYHGEAALSHAHEAAYDAHITAFAFAHIVKLKMVNAAAPVDISKAPCDLKMPFAKQYMN